MRDDLKVGDRVTMSGDRFGHITAINEVNLSFPYTVLWEAAEGQESYETQAYVNSLVLATARIHKEFA